MANGVPKRYHVSLRSDGEVDVAAIAATFGGGGHPSAAGFNAQASLPELKAQLIELADNLQVYGV
jgi:phosphoesterase RecJ-like protein